MLLPLAISMAVIVSMVDGAPKPNQMDIAGVTLGMPIEAAGNALKAAGYKCRSFGTERNFNEEVNKEVENRQGKFTAFPRQSAQSDWSCSGKNGETIKVLFAHPKRGSVVDEILLSLPGAQFSKADIVQQLSRKYGKPTIGTIQNGAWCDTGYRCEASLIFVEGPQFRTMDLGNSVSITATRGKRARDADKAEVVAEADRLAPKAGKAAF